MALKYLNFFGFLIALTMVFAVFLPGVSGGFIFDDFGSIVQNEQLKIKNINWQSIWQLLKAGGPGVLGRPLAMFSFGINYLISGEMNPQSFKLVNIAIHCLAFIAVFGLTRGILRVYVQRKLINDAHVGALALVIALVWALSPLQVSTVLYVVQRMTLLSAAFSFYALWVYVEWRRESINTMAASVLFVLCSVLAFLSKENAILIAGFVLISELFVFNSSNRNEPTLIDKRWSLYRQYLFIMAALSFIAVILYLHFVKHWYTSSFEWRDFSQSERLLTQFRLLITYAYWIIVPNLNAYAFYHDDIVVSTSWITPITTLISAVTLSMLIAAAYQGRKKWPWLVFGLSWFFMGHVLESSFMPLELVFEHRNYLPAFGIVVFVVLLLYSLCMRFKNHQTKLAIVVVWISFLGFSTLLRSAEWGNYHTQFLSAVERHPASSRSNWALARWYIQEYEENLLRGIILKDYYQKAVAYADKSIEADPGSSLALLGLVVFHCEIRAQVEPTWLQELDDRLVLKYRVENHSFFKSITDCASTYNEKSQISPVVYRLFDSVLKSQSISNRFLAELHYVHAMYLYNDKKINKAYTSFKKSLNVRKTENTYIRLVQLSLELKKSESGKKYLAAYKDLLGEGYKVSNNYSVLKNFVDLCCDGEIEFKMRLENE